MKLFFLLTLLASASAFVVPQNNAVQKTNLAATSSEMEESNSVSRRDMLFTGLATSLLFVPTTASAEDVSAIKNVFVSGATGQTGSRCFNKLLADKSVSVVGGVRNVAKASKSLGSNVSLKHLDVVEDSLDALASTLEGVDGLIIASGFNPGKNLLRMAAAAHEVDNVGTCKLIDAAKKAGVKKVVLVSSILTNGRAWGQEESPGFKITNAFGNSLDEKLESELYLRKSGLDYTIVRPGGLQAKAPAGELLISGEDTLNSGEISRDLVADVCIASLTDPKATNKVLEIIEDEGKPPKVFNGLVM